MSLQRSTEIIMYAGDHCADCARSKKLLDSLGVDYTVIEVDGNPGALEKVMETNDGMQSIPVIFFPDGTHLTEPSDSSLKIKLEELSII